MAIGAALSITAQTHALNEHGPNAAFQRRTESKSLALPSPGGRGESSLGLGGRTPVSNLGTFDVVINPDAGLAANPAALAAFERAAATWEKYICDPVTINIDAGLANLGPSILGQAGSVILDNTGYQDLKNALVADNAGSPLSALTAALPNTAQYTAISPYTVFDHFYVTKANAKAIINHLPYGLTANDLDALFGPSDATITFSSTFPFDYDNSDGVTAGTIDFESVALHEIGHALGFVSEVDFVDALKDNNVPGTDPNAEIWITPLDLFRFQNGGPNDPSTLAEFTTFPRFLDTGGDAIFDILSDEYRMSTGSATGDGWQASHFKEEGLNGGIYIGVLDPALSFGQIAPETAADLNVFDLIGWDIKRQQRVPDSSVSVAGLFALGAIGYLARRNRK